MSEQVIGALSLGAPIRQGERGPMGPEGPQGIPGPRGERGEQGPQGERGNDGFPGEKGERGIPGPVGPMGPIGPAGAPGPMGAEGRQGIQGIRGEEGPQGPPGARGPQGIPGPKGETGEQGLPGVFGEMANPTEFQNDLNNIDKTCFYIYGATDGENIENKPGKYSDFKAALILTYRHDNKYKKYQIAISYEYKRVAFRSKMKDNWSEWDYMVNEKQLPPIFDDLGNSNLGVISQKVVTENIRRLEREITKTSRFKFEVSPGQEDDQERVLIDFRQKDGSYIRYKFIHSVSSSRNTDVWRVSRVYKANESGAEEREILIKGEFEMAIKIKNDGQEAPDFFGGRAHGDVKVTKISFIIDGNQKTYEEIKKYTEWTSFKDIEIVHTYDCFNPATPSEKVAEHGIKHIFNTITKNQLVIDQKLKWVIGKELGESYMAMLPISKDISKSFYTDLDFIERESGRYQEGDQLLKEVNILNKPLGISCTFGIVKYPNYKSVKKFFMTDNKNNPYWKCYFIIGDSVTTTPNQIFESQTYYNIKNTNI